MLKDVITQAVKPTRTVVAYGARPKPFWPIAIGIAEIFRYWMAVLGTSSSRNGSAVLHHFGVHLKWTELPKVLECNCQVTKQALVHNYYWVPISWSSRWAFLLSSLYDLSKFSPPKMFDVVRIFKSQHQHQSFALYCLRPFQSWNWSSTEVTEEQLISPKAHLSYRSVSSPAKCPKPEYLHMNQLC